MVKLDWTPGIFMAVILTSAAPFVVARDQASTDYLVGFAHGAVAKAKAGRYHGEEVLRTDDALGFAVVRVAGDRASFEAAARADADVRYVREDTPDAFQAQATPNDPYYAQQYGWKAMNAPAAWNVTWGSASVVVAVLDTGVDHTHPDLAGPRLLQGWNFVANSPDTSDACGHGTHVAGILGATTNNGAGVAGEAQVTILPVKVMDKDPTTGSCSGPFSAVASGIRYAVDNGARVVSMSLGCSGCYDQATEDAIAYATQHNVLLVAAAGNAGPCTNCVVWPASDPSVVAVACTTNGDGACSYSSSGPQVELAAPGDNIYSTVPGGYYMIMSGTSMSTPAVAGAAALAFSVNPSLTGAQVRSLLDSTARDLGPAGLDPTFGYGIVDDGALVQAALATPAAPPANQPPVASFSWSASGLTVSVNAGASYDPDGSVASYAWSWGDGTTGSGVTASHAYAAAGSYAVQLTVTDNAGASSATTQTVTVTAPTPTDHVGAIAASKAVSKQGTKLAWSVPVLSSSGAGVAGASVTASLSGPGVSSTATGTTATSGVASFSLVAKRSGTHTLCVSSVSASGYQYDATQNVATCASVAV
jgi:serine protease